MPALDYPVHLTILTCVVFILLVIAVTLFIYYVLLKFRLHNNMNFWSKQHFVSTGNFMFNFEKSSVNDEILKKNNLPNDNLEGRQEQLKTFNLHFGGLETKENETQSCSNWIYEGMDVPVRQFKDQSREDERDVISSEIVNLSFNHDPVPVEMSDITDNGGAGSDETFEKDETEEFAQNGDASYSNMFVTNEKGNMCQNFNEITNNPNELHVETEVIYAQVNKIRHTPT